MRALWHIRDPITRKRLARFRARRRAYVSLWIMLALYIVSLGAALICNGNPLYLRHNGRSYFPILRFYPESTFVPGGRETRPDYKSLNRTPDFADHPANFMVFPPIPYGPLEGIDPRTLAPEPRVVTTLTPLPRVASIDVFPDLTIRRSQAAAPFFANRDDATLTGQTLTSLWPLPPGLRAALDARFANQPAPAFIAPAQPDGTPADLQLSPFAPRPTPPASVRIQLRAAPDPEATPLRLTFRPDLHIEGGAPPFWQSLPPPARSNLLATVLRAFTEPVYPDTLTLGAALYGVTVQRNDIIWPHAPVRGHWLGIDSSGRDVLARILYGLRTAMTFGFLLVSLSMLLGIVIGAVQGYFGGRIDITVQRLIEIWSSLPFLYIIILLGSIYGRSFTLLLICYGLFNWIGISYYMRAEFLRLRKQPFVDAARALGLRPPRIILHHILPNALTPLITFFPFQLVGAIGSLAALDYLGFGLPPPTASWGELLQQAQQFRWAWWLILYPSAALFLVMLLCVFIGEGVRDAFDPRKYSRME